MKILKDHIVIFLCLMWVGILINANSHFNDLAGFSMSEISLFSLINLIRASSIIIVSLFIIIFYLKEIKFKKDLLINIFYIYIFVQFFSFILIRDIKIEYDQFYFLLNQFLIIFFFHIRISLKEMMPEKLIIINKLFFYILIFFILFVVGMLSLELYPEFFKTKQHSFYYGYFVSPGSLFLEQQVPRVTGISRLILVLIIFSMINLLYSNFKFLSFLISSVLISMLFLTDSRFSFYCFFILAAILFIFDKNFSLQKKTIYFLSVIIFSILINQSLIFVKENSVISKKLLEKQKIEALQSAPPLYENKRSTWVEARIESIQQNKTDVLERDSRLTQDFSTSGRKQDWIAIFKFIKQKPIIGYGFQADRFLIRKPASSAYIYSLVSGGIIGLLLFTSIVILSLYMSIKVIFFDKIFEKKSNIIVKASILINIMIIIRCIIENSISVYNFDLIMFLLTFTIISFYEKYIKKHS